jgi:hypothetical protein
MLASFLLQPVATVSAAVRMDDDLAGRAALVAPIDGEQLGAGEARFAAELPADAVQAWVVAAAQPFDAARWSKLPEDGSFHRADVRGGLVSFDALGLAVSQPTKIWWTVATVSSTGHLRTSAVRSFTALPKFTNRIAPSPYLLETRRGMLETAPKVANALTGAGAPHIRLASGFDFAPIVEGAPMQVESRVVTEDPAGADAPHAYLVQFAAPPADAERAALARAGGELVAYVPDQAYLVRMTPSARAKYEAEGNALWIGDFAPAYKMSPLLADNSIAKTGQYMALLFPDADVRALAAALGKMGATVEAVNDNGVNKLLRFRAPEAGLADVAGLTDVAWVEPVTPKTVENSSAAWVVQTNVLNDYRVWTKGIRGQGQVVMTSDSGMDMTHNMFRDSLVATTDFGDFPTHRKVIAYKRGSNSPAIAFGDQIGASYHGSHTACTLAGNDTLYGVSALDGMAKEAKTYFMDISGPSLANGVLPFDDLNDLFQPPYTGNAGGAARVSSNSWGSNVAGAYDLNSMQVDQFMWNHKDFYIAFSNGNAAAAATVGSPATAKNSAGMGGTRNGSTANQIYTSTSRGPCADGRRKPTFCAPGQSVNSAQSGPNNYALLSGTSMACPSGTGAVVLMRQYLTDGWYPTGAPTAGNGFTPSAALLKAMAVNAADNGVTGFNAPDQNIGYGRIKADNVLFFPGDARKLLLMDNTDGLGQGQFIEYQVNVTETTQPLEVSLCWTDYPGNPAAAVQLVNNLDLTVTNGVSTYKGNVFSAGFSVTGGSADILNVEENVLISVPTAGLYTIRVAAPTVPVGPQPFGLCVTGGVGQNAGALALDRAEYGSTSTVDLQVTDTNAGPSSVNVLVTSPTEPAGETVTLNGANGVFTGTLQLGPEAATPSNGTLSVSHGDALVATYNDASPAATLIANATVSYTTPTITNVKATSQGSSGTLVTYNTNINATGKVWYGLTPALELGSVPEVGARLSHSILLTGLTPGSTYYYDVDATALNGNVTRDDVGGSHYRFTAKGSGDVLLVVGEAGFPRLGTWQSALAADNYDYDLWIGPLADHPALGDLNSGLRSYKAVLWQAGLDQYPPFDVEQRQAVTDYLAGGGRLATFGHDIAWALGDLTSGFADASTQAWLNNTLKIVFNADPSTWTLNTGYAADPLSGSYVGGVPYEPVRTGGAGDEIDIFGAAGGTTAYTWRNNEATIDDIAMRWESGVPNGSAGTALWGGLPSRLANHFFEMTAMDPPYGAPSTIRNNLVDKVITWLYGRTRPLVAVTSPNGGETLTSSPVNITWNETVGGGFNALARTIDYSLDGGDSWTTLTTSAGPSPYSWDLAGVPNSTRCLVRVRVVDDGAPGLAQADASNNTFTINRAGGDLLGPVVVAGSIVVSPNPIVRPNPVALTATVSDAARGASAIAAAEWTFGNAPAPAGTGTPLSLGGSGVTVGVNGTLDSTPFSSGARLLWVRAQDAAGNWGPASSLAVQVNGTPSVGTPEIPRVAFLAQNAPNPFAGPTSVRFGLTRDGVASLAVYSVQGRLVQRLVDGPQTAGVHTVSWDGRDASGARAPSGIYYYRLITGEGRFEKRMVALP